MNFIFGEYHYKKQCLLGQEQAQMFGISNLMHPRNLIWTAEIADGTNRSTWPTKIVSGGGS